MCSLSCLAVEAGSQQRPLELWLEHLPTASPVAAWLLAAQCLGSTMCPDGEADRSCIAASLVLSSLCEKLITEDSTSAEGRKLGSSTFVWEECQRIREHVLKPPCHPWRFLLKVEPEPDEVSRPTYQIIGNTVGAGVWRWGVGRGGEERNVLHNKMEEQ